MCCLNEYESFDTKLLKFMKSEPSLVTQLIVIMESKCTLNNIEKRKVSKYFVTIDDIEGVRMQN